MAQNNPNIQESKLSYSTDYYLDSIILGAGGGVFTVDLKKQLVELNYFEDLHGGTISGKLVISDAVGLLTITGMNGIEFIKISFKKSYDDDVVIDRTFRVYSVTNRLINRSLNQESYNIEFCSEEFLISEQYRVSKSYKGKTITDIIKDVLNNFLKVGTGHKGGKSVYLEQTQGLYDFTLPNKKIIETVNWLTTYGIPKNGTGADMLFYENALGYHFRSLQSLYNEPSSFMFTYNPKNITNNALINYANILNLEVLNYFDTLSALHDGTFYNKMITFDPLTRKKYYGEFNYNNYFNGNKTLNGNPVSMAYKNRYNKGLYEEPPKNMEAGVLRLGVTNKGLRDSSYMKPLSPGTAAPDFLVEQRIPHRVAQLALSIYTRLKLTVSGNPNIFVGSNIDVVVDGMKPLKDLNNPDAGGDRYLDPYLSGKYIISALRHIITPGSYITVMEVCKDSMSEPLAGADGNNAGWKNAVDGGQL